MTLFSGRYFLRSNKENFVRSFPKTVLPIDLMDITCTEKIHEMKINQLWVFHVQRDRESPYISTYVAMSYFITKVLESREPKPEIGDHFTMKKINQY